MEKILTVPEELREEGAVFCTGNDYVSLCHIDGSGILRSISHLRESTMGLIEYAGDRLLSLELDGQPLQAREACYIHDFIPQFRTAEGAVTWQFFAPEGIRGFCVRVLTRGIRGSLRLALRPDRFLRTVFHPLPLRAEAEYRYDKWSDTVCLELVAGGGISALSMGGQGCRKTFTQGSLALEKDVAGDEEICFFVTLGCELDGARLANVDMRRRGRSLFPKTAALLDSHHISLPDPQLDRLANLNMCFCRYFSVGRCLDTDRLVLVTSRSGRYYVSGAYWARDCMLWAFPALLRWDEGLAREALLTACTTYLKNGAGHALYMNGVSLYPGFELDQLVAPIIALERYRKITGDTALWDDPRIREAVRFTLETLERWRDSATGLFATELSPSDDPCAFPFLTYDNHLVLAALKIMGDPKGWIPALRESLRTHCVRSGRYLWSCDGKGGGEDYDNPPGSLLLIPYYGGCSSHDPIWRATLDHYFSRENPWYTENELLSGQGCEHAPAPWPMSLCDRALSMGREEAVLRSLRAMEMDNGIACETVRPENGRACTGAAFATFAGFYANAIFECYEDNAPIYG